MAAFADVLLRGIGSWSQAVVIGGVLFAVFVLRPASAEPVKPPRLVGRTLTLIMVGAVALAAIQGLSLLVQLEALADDRGWPIPEAFATTYFHAATGRLLVCAGVAAVCWTLRRGHGGTRWWLALIGLSVGAALSSAWMSHAAARLEKRAVLLALDALHQLAVGVWIGGLTHLASAAFRLGEQAWPVALLRRFSGMALAAVATLVSAGIGLSLAYIDGLDALIGTAYGLMVVTKSAILGGLLALGTMNFLAVRRFSEEPSASLVRVRRFVEAEIGLGVTALFVAASLTSLPPAVDLVADRATLAEVAARLAPRWPTFTSPTIGELPVRDRDSPRPDVDRVWSEYNHHIAGLFVVTMGLLATVQRTRWTRWARHWPLLFLGLGGFLFMRNDPEAWPLGPVGFWESMANPVVLQHRFFVPLVIAFGLFEWMVRTERLRSPRCALVFPLLCAVGAGLLLAHTHSPDNLKEQFLIEVTHAPLGVLGVLVGWARWLELRLPPPDGRIPGRLWPLAFTLIGILLLFYREN